MKRTFLILSILTILFYACKEDDIINTPQLNSTQASQDHLTAESIFNDVERVIKEGFINNGEAKSCPNYNLINADTSDIDTLIIDFPEGQCQPIYGKIRTGKIIVTYNGKYHDSLSIITSTFDNYYINNNLIQGERIVTNQGRNSHGNLCFKIDINNVSITTPLNGTINWESERIREWINGEDTYYDISDDKYQITGNSNGNSANGNDFYIEIITPLNIDSECLSSCVIKSGTAKISPLGYNDRIINYGDSLCDCNVNLIIDDNNNYPLVIGY
tara:strand:+ start:688 stop:1506 length:819 start_codon:yes stop_codon:yes gene_type:complete